MKKVAAIIIAMLLALGIAGFIGYTFFSDNIGLLSHTISSEDKKYSMKVPLFWKTTEPASDQGVLAAQNKKGSIYVTASVDSEYMTSGQTVEDYVYAYIERIAQNSDNPLVQVLTVPPQNVKMADKTGYYFELDTAAGDVMVHTWDFIYTSGDGYVHIDVASKGDKQDEVHDIARSIIESFKINS